MSTKPPIEKFSVQKIIAKLTAEPYINMKGSAWRRKIERVALFKDGFGKVFVFPVDLNDEKIEMRPLYLDDVGDELIVRLGHECTEAIAYKPGTDFEKAVYYYNLNRPEDQGMVVPLSLMALF